jgi:hypothetical protein
VGSEELAQPWHEPWCEYEAATLPEIAPDLAWAVGCANAIYFEELGTPRMGIGFSLFKLFFYGGGESDPPQTARRYLDANLDRLRKLPVEPDIGDIHVVTLRAYAADPADPKNGRPCRRPAGLPNPDAPVSEAVQEWLVATLPRIVGFAARPSANHAPSSPDAFETPRDSV